MADGAPSEDAKSYEHCDIALLRIMGSLRDAKIAHLNSHIENIEEEIDQLRELNRKWEADTVGMFKHVSSSNADIQRLAKRRGISLEKIGSAQVAKMINQLAIIQAQTTGTGGETVVLENGFYATDESIEGMDASRRASTARSLTAISDFTFASDHKDKRDYSKCSSSSHVVDVPTVPERLVVQGIPQMQILEGIYERIDNVNPNNYPLWAHTSESFYIFAGIDGLVLIGGRDERQEDFETNSGFVASRALHEGKMPPLLDWMIDDGTDWLDDDGIQIRVASEVGEALRNSRNSPDPDSPGDPKPTARRTPPSSVA